MAADCNTASDANMALLVVSELLLTFNNKWIHYLVIKDKRNLQPQACQKLLDKLSCRKNYLFLLGFQGGRCFFDIRNLSTFVYLLMFETCNALMYLLGYYNFPIYLNFIYELSVCPNFCSSVHVITRVNTIDLPYNWYKLLKFTLVCSIFKMKSVNVYSSFKGTRKKFCYIMVYWERCLRCILMML